MIHGSCSPVDNHEEGYDEITEGVAEDTIPYRWHSSAAGNIKCSRATYTSHTVRVSRGDRDNVQTYAQEGSSTQPVGNRSPRLISHALPHCGDHLPNRTEPEDCECPETPRPAH
jgi:hypothetical protein